MITKEEENKIVLNAKSYSNGYKVGFKECGEESKDKISSFKKIISKVLNEMNDVIKSLGDK